MPGIAKSYRAEFTRRALEHAAFVGAILAHAHPQCCPNRLDRHTCLGHVGDMVRLFIRVDFESSGSALGPGMAELLERISEKGSIRQGAAVMGMSYRKAWLLLRDMHQTFGAAVVLTETGGSGGGRTCLSELGTKLLRTFRALEKTAASAAEDEMHALSVMVQGNAVARRKRRKA